MKKQEPEYPRLAPPVLDALENAALPAADFDLIPLTDAFAYFVAQKAAAMPDQMKAATTMIAATKIREACDALRGPDATIANDNTLD